MLWKLIHAMIIKYQNKHKDWIFIRHEDISRDPLHHFKNIFDRTGLEFSKDIQKEIRKGKGVDDSYVYLDMRHLGEKRINERLPGIRQLCKSFAGVDPVYDLVPIQPAQHYTMGGIDTNIDAETKALGLYAAGECACVSVHGANRLGGNSLLETIVFGKIAGEKAADYILSGGSLKRNDNAINDAVKRDNNIIENFLKSSGKERFS